MACRLNFYFHDCHFVKLLFLKDFHLMTWTFGVVPLVGVIKCMALFNGGFFRVICLSPTTGCKMEATVAGYEYFWLIGSDVWLVLWAFLMKVLYLLLVDLTLGSSLHMHPVVLRGMDITVIMMCVTAVLRPLIGPSSNGLPLCYYW